MSVLTISAASPVGVLADGTPYYAPIGEVIVDGSLVTCHLCGRALRSVTAHLRAHGWTKLAYCEAFGLERGRGTPTSVPSSWPGSRRAPAWRSSAARPG